MKKIKVKVTREDFLNAFGCDRKPLYHRHDCPCCNDDVWPESIELEAEPVESNSSADKEDKDYQQFCRIAKISPGIARRSLVEAYCLGRDDVTRTPNEVTTDTSSTVTRDDSNVTINHHGFKIAHHLMCQSKLGVDYKCTCTPKCTCLPEGTYPEKPKRLLAPALWREKTTMLKLPWKLTEEFYESKEEAFRFSKHNRTPIGIDLIWPAIPNKETGFYEIQE